MAYQALYRQWRPKDFSHMVSQEAVVDTLRNQIMTGRIAHAYLFCGSRGTGKTSTAKIMARAVNCESPVNGDPCGQCPNCLRLQEESLDVVEIDAASNNGVDEMRDLRETVKYPPQYGKYKVYIIDEVHMLSTSAFNALLKTLEEPPAHIVFILATTEPQKLPATILSRCQRFDFGRIPVSQIVGRLREATEGAGGKATSGALMLIARAAEGGMRDALSILDMCLGYGSDVDEKLVRNVLGTSDKAFLFDFERALIDADSATVLNMIDHLMRSGREPGVFAKEISQHTRTLIAAKCCGEQVEQLLDLTGEDAAEYIRQGESASVSRLMEILDLFMKLETETRFSSSPRIALETFALKACLRSKEVDVQALTDRISELEAKIAQLTENIGNGTLKVSVQETKKETKAEKKNAPEQTAIPQKTMTAVGRGTDDCWKAALDTIKRTGPSIYPMLSGFGRYLGSDGHVFRWMPNPGNEIFAKSLSVETNKKIIEAALTEAAGAECVFSIENGQQNSPKHTDQGEEQYVNSLKSIFGEGPVIVKD